MKKTYQIFCIYKAQLEFLNFKSNNFHTREDAENFLVNPEKQHLFEKDVEYTILPVFLKE